MRMGATTFPRIRIRAGPNSYILLAVLTTAQRDALSAAAGYLIYNSTTAQVESYNGSAWVAVGKLYGDATFLPLAGGALTGDVTMSALKTIDTMDPSVHLADLSAHIRDMLQVVRISRYLVSPLIVGGPSSTDTIGANLLVAVPYPIVRPMTADRIAVEVSTGGAAGALLRLGIYNDNGAGLPGTLKLDAGTVDSTTTGLKTITISHALARGLYWLAVIGNTAGVAVYRSGVTFLQLVGRSANLQNIDGGVYKTQTYGALPDPFGTEDSTLNNMYALALRFASLD